MFCRTFSGCFRNIEARDDRCSGGGRQQAAKHPDGRGFARAVRPEESEDFAFARVEANVIDRDEVAEALHEIANDDRVVGGRSCSDAQSRR